MHILKILKQKEFRLFYKATAASHSQKWRYTTREFEQLNAISSFNRHFPVKAKRSTQKEFDKKIFQVYINILYLFKVKFNAKFFGNNLSFFKFSFYIGKL